MSAPSYMQVIESIARHEVAHLVVAQVLSPGAARSVSLTLRADRSGVDGEALIDHANLSDADSLVVIFAGPAADSAFGHAGEDDTKAEDGSDAARLTEVALRFGPAAEREFFAATRRAEKLVAQFQFEITTLAQALAATPFIEGVATIAGEDLQPFLPLPRYSPWTS
jgi:hypothetical protein